MNCKPGDLAVRVRNSNRSKLTPEGSVVTCLRVVPSMESASSGVVYRNVWVVEHAGRMVGPNGYPLGIPDCDLTPIRDPGDDAQDESLQWLPVPSTEKEAA